MKRLTCKALLRTPKQFRGGPKPAFAVNAAPSTPAPGGGPRRSRLRVLRIVMLVLLVVGIYGLLPRLGGLGKEAEVLRQADPFLIAGALGAEVISLLLYVIFYRQVLSAMGVRPSFRTVFDVTMASFLVSHVSAYSVANILSAIPITPAGLGVIEATLVAVTVAFGAPTHAAVPAVLGYRIVNFWLPLPVGVAAYLHLRLTRGRLRGRS